MKHALPAAEAPEPSVKERSRRTKARSAPTDTLAGLKRLFDARFRRVEGRIKALGDELRASEVTLASAELRVFNEQQSHEGLGRLRADLMAMRAKGIVDEKGNRLRKDLPATMSQETSCDV